MTETVEYIDATEIVESDKYILGDGFGVDANGNDTHLVMSKQEIMDMKTSELTNAFIDSVSSQGIVHPIAATYAMRQDENDKWVRNGQIIIRDGHHRLAAAYLLNQKVPVIMNRYFNSPIEDLPYCN